MRWRVPSDIFSSGALFSELGNLRPFVLPARRSVISDSDGVLCASKLILLQFSQNETFVEGFIFYCVMEKSIVGTAVRISSLND